MSGEEVRTEEVPEEEMTFTSHLEELRNRLVKCIIAAIIGFLACYGFAEQLFDLLMAPLVQVLPPGGSLIYTGLPEGFFTYLKVAFLAGLFVASPYIFYQIWAFIAPGLYESERKYMLPVAFFSALFFVCGAVFGYTVVFPFGFDFFMGFATDAIQPMPSLKEYFSFSTKLLIAFGLVFELPLFIFFLARMGLVTARGLRRKQKYAILCSFVVSAILTPPDIISQIFMSGPLIVLYEAGIWVAHFFGKKPKKEAAAEEEETAPVPSGDEASGSGETL
jgi:sec-independent protein translocase protein TatC